MFTECDELTNRCIIINICMSKIDYAKMATEAVLERQQCSGKGAYFLLIISVFIYYLFDLVYALTTILCFII